MNTSLRKDEKMKMNQNSDYRNGGNSEEDNEGWTDGRRRIYTINYR